MNQLIHILHLEDDPVDAELVHVKIEAAGLICQITHVQTRDEFDAALRQGEHDIILADFRLPMYDGMSALRLAQEVCPDIPFIFVSGTMGEDAVIEGFTEGATDYVLKQSLTRLVPSIRRALHEAGIRHERKRVKEELHKLSRAVEQSANTIIITNIEGYIEYANPKFTETSGYSLAEALEQHTSILKSGSTPPEVYQQLWETINAGKEWRGEFQNKKKNGEIYWESASISPIKNTDGVITHFLAVKEDITARKQAEEAHAKLEDQLRQSQKMESIGRLASGVAHDFNNLLTVILGYSDLLQIKVGIKHPWVEDLEQIRRAGERAATLTRQLLAFSRQQALAPVILDLNRLVINLQKMLERLIGEDITLSTTTHPALWPITADPGQIEQVVMNLVVNARDAMPTGGKITIETNNVYLDDNYVQTHIEATIGPCVMLAVSDTGYGMDSAIQARIFEPFFTTKEQGKGTGLGLSTVYGIIKQSGGDITVYSEPGQGTTFKIYLPATETTAISLSTPQTQMASHHSTGVILLVEDDDSLRDLVRKTLQTEGYTILEAGSGAKALSLVKQFQGEIDLLLTDVVMPLMNGRELAEQLSVLYPKAKILFMSGYTNDTVVRHGLLTTEIEFLAKPFAPNTLITRVNTLLDK